MSDNLVVSGSYDHTIKLWTLLTGACQQTLRGHTGPVLTVAFDKNKIISGAADKTIKVSLMFITIIFHIDLDLNYC